MGKKFKLCLKITIKPMKFCFNKKKAAIKPLKNESSDILKCPSDTLDSSVVDISPNESIKNEEYSTDSNDIYLNASIETLKPSILVEDENKIKLNTIDSSGQFLPRDTKLEFFHENNMPFKVKDLTINLNKFGMDLYKRLAINEGNL